MLVVVLSLLICFSCLEIGLRVWGPEYYRVGLTWELDREIIEGDTELVRYLHEYHSNPRGYFSISRKEGEQIIYGIEFAAVSPPFKRIPKHTEKPDDVLAFHARKGTVLALGDSFTMGQGVRYEDTYVRRLETLLAKGGKDLGIENTGSPGYELEEICTVYAMCSAEWRYPLVIYGFVLNDFGLPGEESIIGSDFIDFNNGGYQYDPWRTRYASVNFVHRCLERIRLDRMTRRSYLEAFKGRNANGKFELLGELNGNIGAQGGELVIVLFPLLHEFHDYPFHEIHDKVCAFCLSNDILLLDLLPAFSEHKAESLWVHPTDYHPNEIAHRIAAEEIHAFLKGHGLLETLVVEEPQP